MFDKRHYQNDPRYQKLREEQQEEERRMIERMQAAPKETQEEVRKRARNLGNKKTKNARGRRWWDQR
jgi:hypothetical protein